MRTVPDDTMPAFEAGLVGGRSWRLAEEHPSKLALLVFYHGLHCPICRKWLGTLERAVPRFNQHGVSVIALSCDTSERAERAKSEWNAAQPAGLERVLRVDARIARGEGGAQVPGFLAPLVEQPAPVAVQLDLRQDVLLLREAPESHLARVEAREGHRVDSLRRRHRVERELWVVGTLAEPGVASRLPGLVVDQRVAAFLQPVHAVDAAGELEPGDVESAPFFQRPDCEGGARLLDLEPFARQPPQALALQLGEASLEAQLLHRRRRGFDDGGVEIMTQVLAGFHP